MRASHCSKTYQLAPAWPANSACFRAFLTKITGFSGFLGLWTAHGVPYGVEDVPHHGAFRASDRGESEENSLIQDVVLPLACDVETRRRRPILSKPDRLRTACEAALCTKVAPWFPWFEVLCVPAVRGRQWPGVRQGQSPKVDFPVHGVPRGDIQGSSQRHPATLAVLIVC